MRVGNLYHFLTVDELRLMLQNDFRVDENFHLTRNYKLADFTNVGNHITRKSGYIYRLNLDGDKLHRDFRLKPIRGLRDGPVLLIKPDKWGDLNLVNDYDNDVLSVGTKLYSTTISKNYLKGISIVANSEETEQMALNLLYRGFNVELCKHWSDLDTRECLIAEEW